MRPKQVVLGTTAFLCTLLAAYLVVRLLSLLILFILAFILASAISPLVRRLNRRLPLAASIGLVYLVIVLAGTALFAILIPPLVSQSGRLMENAPVLVARAQDGIENLRQALHIPANVPMPNIERSLDRFLRNAPVLASGALNVAIGFITGIVGIVLVFVFAFYWLLERRDIQGTWISLVPAAKRGGVREVIADLEAKLGGYVRAQLMIAVIIGVASFIGLKVLGVEFALVLALVAGMTEFIPVAGPIIAATPAILIALTQSPRLAILVALLYVVIQQVENYVLVPKVMERTVGLSPLTVLAVILAGTVLLGIVGATLAVPVAIAMKLVLERTLFSEQPALIQAPIRSDRATDSATAPPHRAPGHIHRIYPGQAVRRGDSPIP